jgi:hypothetical protein
MTVANFENAALACEPIREICVELCVLVSDVMIRRTTIGQQVLVRAIGESAVLHPKHGKRAMSRKSADAIAPRAQILCANDSCTAGEFPAGTLDEGNPGELLPLICSAVRTAAITRR